MSKNNIKIPEDNMNIGKQQQVIDLISQEVYILKKIILFDHNHNSYNHQLTRIKNNLIVYICIDYSSMLCYEII